MPSAIEILITARDEASKTLQGVRNELVLLDQYGRVASDLSQKFDGGAQSFDKFAISGREATRAVRALTIPIAAELSPALGAMVGQMSGVISHAALLSSGFTSIGIGAVGLAAIIGGQVVEVFKKWEKQAEDLRKAQDGLTFETLVSGATTARVTVQDLGDQLERLKKIQDSIKAAPGDQRTSFALGSVLGSDEANKDRERILKEWVAAGQRAFAITRGREASGFSEAENALPLGTGDPGNTVGVDAARRMADIRKQTVEAGILDPIEKAFQASIREAEAALLSDTSGQGASIKDRLVDLAKATRDAALRQRALAFQAIPIEGIDEAARFEGSGAGVPIEEQRLERLRQVLFEIQRREFVGKEAAPEPGIDEVGRFEAVGAGTLDPDALARARKSASDADLRDRERILAMNAQILASESLRTDLSREQAKASELQAIEAARLLAIEQARGDAAKELNANLEAQAKIRAVQERDEAIPGFLRGLKTVEDEFGAMGLRMQSLAQNAADGMARGFSDGFFDVITGNFKDLPNVARSFTASMVRSVTDELGKLVTAPILGTLRSLLTAGGLGALSVMPGAGAGSGGGPLSFLTPATAEASAPMVSATGRPISGADIKIAVTQAGDSGVRALQAGRATVADGQFIPETFDLPGFSTGPSAMAVQSPSGGLFRQALPVAGNAAAFGLSAFGATGARTNADVGISTALGALSGAGLGASVGRLFDAGGLGAGIGAVGGAAVNASLALVAQQEAEKQAAKQRQAAEAARASGAGGDLVSSAGGASSLADLFRRITAFGSGYTGGSANPAVSTTVGTPGGPKAVGTPNPYYPVGDVLDILRNPTSLQANIQAGVNPALLSGPNAVTSKALQDRASDLVGQFRQTEQGVGVTQEDLVPGGLTRRTTVPASRADALSPTADLSIDELALNALSDDDKAVLLLDVMSRVAADKDIKSTISDGATGQIVSITRMARSTIGLPPATTPVPAPVTTGTPPVTTPSLSTADLLTTGGALSLGLVGQLADKNSILNALLPAGFTGPDAGAALAAAVKSLFETGSLSTAGGTVTVADLVSQGEGLSTVFNDASAGGSLGFGDAVAALGGISGLYNLVLGAQAADPASIVQGALSVYSALSSIAPATFTPITTALGSAFASLAPEAATSLVSALGGTVAGATATGAEVATAALAAAAPWIAVAAPVIMWAVMKLLEPGPGDAWAIVGKTATMLQSVAWTSIERANATFAGLRALRITDPEPIKQAIAMGSSALFAYNRNVQNPRGGTISVATFYAYTKQDPTPIQQGAALLQQNMKDAIAELSRQGVAPASLGNLAPAQVSELLVGQPYSDAIRNAPKIVPGVPLLQSVQVGEGDMLVDTGRMTDPIDQTQNVNQGIAASSGRLLTPDIVSSEYGGPLWALLRYLEGPSAVGYDVHTPQITGAQAWLAGGAAPGAVSGPTAQEAPLQDWEIANLLAIAAMLQGIFTGGGGPGAPGPSAPTGMPGDNGEGLGEGPGAF